MPAPLRASTIPSRLPALLTSLCLGLATCNAFALGVGDMRALSAIGEPLSVELDLVDLGGVRLSEIRIQIASAEDHVRLGLTPPPVSGPLSVQILPAGLMGLARISVSGWSPAQQTPNLLLQLSWPGGLRLQQVLVTLANAPSRQAPGVEPPALPQASLVDAPPAATPAPVVEAVTEIPPSQVIQIDPHRIRVSPDDTLSSLASRWSVQGLSLSQRKQLLAEANPHIFHYGDVRQLRAGSVVTLPAGGEVRRLPSLAQADAWVQQHESGQSRVARPFDPVAEAGAVSAGRGVEPVAQSSGAHRSEPAQEIALTLVAPATRSPLDPADAPEVLRSAQDERDQLSIRHEDLTRRLQQLKQEAADRQVQLKVLDERLAALSKPQPANPLTRLAPWEQFSTIILALLALGFMLAGLLSRWRTPGSTGLRQSAPELTPTPTELPPAVSAPASAGLVDPDEDEYDFLSDAQVEAYQTRLDLARAYLDMGEAEAARELLRAVAAGGSPTQRDDARQLLTTAT